MDLLFNSNLAAGLQALHAQVIADRSALASFLADPTGVAKAFLAQKAIEIPDPETFHVHALKPGEDLPKEPQRATIDRYIYVFRESGLFEFKVVPGSPEGKDDFMYKPTGACACCNCGCLYVPNQ